MVPRMLKKLLTLYRNRGKVSMLATLVTLDFGRLGEK